MVTLQLTEGYYVSFRIFYNMLKKIIAYKIPLGMQGVYKQFMV